MLTKYISPLVTVVGVDVEVVEGVGLVVEVDVLVEVVVDVDVLVEVVVDVYSKRRTKSGVTVNILPICLF